MAIIIHELEHRYEDGSAGEKVALHDVNIKIEQGEMIVRRRKSQREKIRISGSG